MITHDVDTVGRPHMEEWVGDFSRAWEIVRTHLEHYGLLFYLQKTLKT